MKEVEYYYSLRSSSQPEKRNVNQVKQRMRASKEKYKNMTLRKIIKKLFFLKKLKLINRYKNIK